MQRIWKKVTRSWVQANQDFLERRNKCQVFAKGRRGQLFLVSLSDGVRQDLSTEFVQNKPADDFEHPRQWSAQNERVTTWSWLERRRKEQSMKRRENELTIPMSAFVQIGAGKRDSKRVKNKTSRWFSKRRSCIFCLGAVKDSLERENGWTKERMGGWRKGWMDEGEDGLMKERMGGWRRG